MNKNSKSKTKLVKDFFKSAEYHEEPAFSDDEEDTTKQEASLKSTSVSSSAKDAVAANPEAAKPKLVVPPPSSQPLPSSALFSPPPVAVPVVLPKPQPILEVIKQQRTAPASAALAVPAAPTAPAAPAAPIRSSIAAPAPLLSADALLAPVASNTSTAAATTKPPSALKSTPTATTPTTNTTSTTAATTTGTGSTRNNNRPMKPNYASLASKAPQPAPSSTSTSTSISTSTSTSTSTFNAKQQQPSQQSKPASKRSAGHSVQFDSAAQTKSQQQDLKQQQRDGGNAKPLKTGSASARLAALIHSVTDTPAADEKLAEITTINKFVALDMERQVLAARAAALEVGGNVEEAVAAATGKGLATPMLTPAYFKAKKEAEAAELRAMLAKEKAENDARREAYLKELERRRQEQGLSDAESMKDYALDKTLALVRQLSGESVNHDDPEAGEWTKQGTLADIERMEAEERRKVRNLKKLVRQRSKEAVERGEDPAAAAAAVLAEREAAKAKAAERRQIKAQSASLESNPFAALGGDDDDDDDDEDDDDDNNE